MKTSIAFIIFNRPDTTERVFAAIAKAQPPKLLVIADGPRPNRPDDIEKCKVTRDIIKRVDWPCELLTNFSETNLGCKNRVSSGIDWVFTQTDEAIILEDDCLPEDSFFQFCEEMLEKYRFDQRIGMISGVNFLNNKISIQDSYYFSKYMPIWGWATWRRSWSNYDVNIDIWPKLKREGFLDTRINKSDERSYWNTVFERIYKGTIDTWDYQWVLCNWIQNRLSIIPNVNLISNIGFRSDATHTSGSSIYSDMNTKPILFPLKHPENIYSNTRADIYSARAQFTDIFRRLLRNKVKAYLFNQMRKLRS